MVRKVAAVLVGMAVVVGVVMCLQYVGQALHPLPEGVDPTDPADREAFAAYVQGVPALSWALAFASELVGGFLGALAAGWIARDHRAWFAGGIVALALAGSVMNWTSFAHPTWFVVGQLVGYPLALLAALVVLRRGRAPDAGAAAQPTG